MTGRIGGAVCAATLAWAGLCALAPAPARAQCSPQELAKLIASDAAAMDNFGFSVAVSGDTAVVGSYQDNHASGPGGFSGQGAAYIFVRTGTTWTQQAKLIASDGAASDQFGNAVAISGDTVIVGAHYDDFMFGVPPIDLIDPGAAYVFVRTGTTWTQQAKLVASDPESLDEFGWSVSVDGDTAVIAAYVDNIPGAPSGGSAYVFVRAGTSWTQQAKLTASDAASVDQFGRSVALSGDTAVIGANLDNHAGGTDAGSAYVFTRSGAVWTQQAKLTASDAAANAQFGVSVAVGGAGNTAVVGANFADASNDVGAGSAYIFVKPPGGWANMTETAKLTASDGMSTEEFGHAVALSGNTALIGAHLNDHTGLLNPGAAYVFVKPSGGWATATETAKLTASDAARIDVFGFAVALSGNTALVGAWADDHAGGMDAGSAYIFGLAGCIADFNCGGGVNSQDFFDFLAAFFASAPAADVNGDGVVNSQDFFDFLAAFFAGC